MEDRAGEGGYDLGETEGRLGKEGGSVRGRGRRETKREGPVWKLGEGRAETQAFCRIRGGKMGAGQVGGPQWGSEGNTIAIEKFQERLGPGGSGGTRED